ncbi:MAG: synthase protein [Eubacteriales bacterium]|nr:synthase protein [Eubacteriales bacterium]
MKPENQWENLKALGIILSLGTSMGVAVATGYIIGRYLDRKLQAEPWFTVIMVLLGVATALKMAYQALNSGRPKGGQKNSNNKK